MAAGLSKALGKHVKYVDVPLEAAREAMLGMGLPEWIADAFPEYFKAFSEGYGDFTTPDVEKVTGHPARSYESPRCSAAQFFKPPSCCDTGERLGLSKVDPISWTVLEQC